MRIPVSASRPMRAIRPTQTAIDTAAFVHDRGEPGFGLRVEVVGDLPFVHRRTGMPLDVVLSGSGLEQQFAGGRGGGAFVPAEALSTSNSDEALAAIETAGLLPLRDRGFRTVRE